MSFESIPSIYWIYLLVGLASLVLGYIFFKFIFAFIQKRLGTDVTEQRREIIEEAEKQAQAIKAEYEDMEAEKLQLMQEELESEIKTVQSVLAATEEEIESGELFANGEEGRIARSAKDVETVQQKVAVLQKDLQDKQNLLNDTISKLRKRLEEVSRTNIQKLLTTMTDDMIETRRLECQKLLRIIYDDLQTSSNRLAKRVLSSVLSRYSPGFSWPKAVNHIEIEDAKIGNLLGSSTETMAAELKELKEKTQVEFELFKEDDASKLVVKLAGGGGMEREAIRLTLTELSTKKIGTLATMGGIFQRHCKDLEEQALSLGRQAVKELKLDNVHPEIQKMIGQLFWRTSYRQNQYFHSIEVAKLAGILAHEFKENTELVKRAALFHDIGKAIDYKIEQNHAIISADYADRYGESIDVCNAILTHHNDIVSESTVASILKTADTLSGARPGTRVNLEEGYQIRISAIEDVIKSFGGIQKSAIMNGGREVHVEVNPKKVREDDLKSLSDSIAKKIEKDVAFPGQIKVLVSRRFESVAVA